MKNYNTFHKDLPALQNGYNYYKLKELVDALEIKDDTFACYVDMRENDIREIRYIRTVNLSSDYRNCDIKTLSVTKAPYWVRSYQPSTSKLVDTLEVYDTDNNNGGYAAFVDGQIKVGKMSATPNSFPISKNIAHFAAKANGVSRTEYILRELTSEYVRERVSQFYQIYHEVNRFDLYELMIRVPSLEVQDELLKSEALVSIQMEDVFTIIDKYFSDESKQFCINNLREIIGTATSGLIMDTNNRFNSLRIILEYLFRAANTMGFLHDNCIVSGDVNIWNAFHFMSGHIAYQCGYVQCKKTHFPAPIEKSVEFIINVTHPGSHSDRSTPEGMKLQQYLQYMDTPYLLYSTAYLLCDVIIWFGKYSKEYPNKEENKKLWH